MPLSEYFIGLLIASPLIALLLFIFTGRGKPFQKFIASRDKFYILRRDFSFPTYIYIEKNFENQNHDLFIETPEAVFKISEFVPWNLDMGFMAVDVYLREIYGDSITDVTLSTTKYDWKDEIKINFKKRDISFDCYTETHESFDCSKR